MKILILALLFSPITFADSPCGPLAGNEHCINQTPSEEEADKYGCPFTTHVIWINNMGTSCIPEIEFPTSAEALKLERTE